jgi:hypothetical protein
MMGGVGTASRLLGGLGFFRIVAASKKLAADRSP